MRKIVIERSQRSTLRLVGTGEEESGSALSPFGPVRAGLTTTPRTGKEVPLMVLLNSLERQIAELNTKSYEVLNTLLQDTTRLVEPISFSSKITITDSI